MALATGPSETILNYNWFIFSISLTAVVATHLFEVNWFWHSFAFLPPLLTKKTKGITRCLWLIADCSVIKMIHSY